MRNCVACGKDKDDSAFIDPTNGKPLSRCLPCAEHSRKYYLKYRARNIEAIREYDRQRKRGKKKKAMTVQDKARQAARNAFQSGRIERKSVCERCGSSDRVQGHHRDYSKPLELEWICRACHALEHRKPLFTEQFRKGAKYE